MLHTDARIVPALASLLIASSVAAGAWTVTDLNPLGAAGSNGWGIGGGQQAGTIFNGANFRASVWSGSSGSIVNLHPAAWRDSYLLDTDGVSQVGYLENVGAGNYIAAMWQGTPAVTILAPTGSTQSRAEAVFGNQQVGYARFGSPYARAGMWSGSASSWTSLHPSFAAGSDALGTDGTHQVGNLVAAPAGPSWASLWTGTASSWVNLSPIVATESLAFDVDAGQQVGYAVVAGKQRASLWKGTASSWIDLTPLGGSSSQAFGVDAGWQVGHVDGHAGIWNGTAGSWVDLHTLLPSNFNESFAQAVEVTATMICVVGTARDAAAGTGHAVLWCQSIPTPSSLAVLALAGLMGGARRRKPRAWPVSARISFVAVSQ